MHEFTYIKPETVSAAAATLKAHGDAKLLAGGMSLLSAMKLRLAAPSHLIDLARLGGLNAIERNGGDLVIGAMTRHVDVATSPLVRSIVPALAHLAGGIGDRQVRNRGTLGGAIANADPAACYPAALLALSATIITDRRKIAADDFFTGIYETALEPDEIITAVRFLRPTRAGYMKFPHPASRFALVGVFVATFHDWAVRVAVTGAGSSVFRASAIEAALAGSYTPEAAMAVTIPADGLNSDHAASSEYRAHLVAVMAARAVAQSLATPKGS
jgi:aerobic carbon-monoxide dehydrogenase medium subunit